MSQPVSPGTTRSSVPSTLVPITARRAAIASRTTLGIPSQSEGRMNRSAAFSIEGTSSRRPSQMTRPSRPGSERAIACKGSRSGAVTDEDEPPVRPFRPKLVRRFEQDRKAFLRVEPADEQGERRIRRDADRRAVKSHCGVDRGGVDAVGDHGQAVGVEPADLDAEPSDPLRDADRSGREPGRESIQDQVPTPLPLGHAKSADDPGRAGDRRGELRGEVGVEQERLDDLGSQPFQNLRKPRHDPDRFPSAHPQADRFDPGRSKRLDERPFGTEADDRGCPPSPIEAGCDRDEDALGTADIEVGDREGDRDRPVGSWFERGGRESSGEGLHGNGRPGCDGEYAIILTGGDRVCKPRNSILICRMT